MIDRNHFESTLAHGNRLARHHGFVAQHRTISGRQPGEIRPYHPIKNVALQRFDSRRLAVHYQRFGALFENAVQHERDKGNMVEMGVSEKDMANSRHFIEAEIPNAAAGVNEDISVDQE
jgi:hypothetical protein